MNPEEPFDGIAVLGRLVERPDAKVKEIDHEARQRLKQASLIGDTVSATSYAIVAIPRAFATSVRATTVCPA